MLTQLKYGCYYLEDPSGVVKLDMTETKFHTGLYTENCFVLAEGWYDDEVFHVLALGFPPAESNAITRKYFGNTNFFGGPSETTLKAWAYICTSTIYSNSRTYWNWSRFNQRDSFPLSPG